MEKLLRKIKISKTELGQSGLIFDSVVGGIIQIREVVEKELMVAQKIMNMWKKPVSYTDQEVASFM